MSNKFYSKFEEETREIIVLIQNVLGASPFGEQWEMAAITLGMVFCADGRVDVKKGRLNWLVSEAERNSEKGWNRFQKGQICRIKARKLQDIYAPQNITPEEFNAWYVVEIMEQKAVCPKLEEVWKAYCEPVVMEDEVLGRLILNREFDVLEGSFSWNDAEILLMLEVDAEDKSTWRDACNAAGSMVAEMEKWDQAMRAFSAKALTDLANDWQADADENAAPITEEIFAERISLSELTFSFEDSFTAYYADDDMFWGHAIEVCGSLEQGIECANIVG